MDPTPVGRMHLEGTRTVVYVGNAFQKKKQTFHTRKMLAEDNETERGKMGPSRSSQLR